jgi:hypothetical protein
MAFVNKSDRFDSRMELDPEPGPGEYISQSAYKVKKSIIPFGSLTNRNLDDPWQDGYMDDPNLRTEEDSQCDHCTDFVPPQRSLNYPSGYFGSKTKRFPGEKSRSPGPGAYKVPHLTSESKSIKNQNLQPGQLRKGINSSQFSDRINYEDHSEYDEPIETFDTEANATANADANASELLTNSVPMNY